MHLLLHGHYKQMTSYLSERHLWMSSTNNCVFPQSETYVYKLGGKFRDGRLSCYEFLILWDCRVMNFSCYEIVLLWISHIMRLACYDTLMLWDSHVMRFLCYETLILWYSHVLRLPRYDNSPNFYIQVFFSLFGLLRSIRS